MTMQRVPPLSLFEESPLRRMIIERLRETNANEVIPYGELSKIVGDRVDGSARYLLNSARRALLREDGIVFGVVRGVGLKRLDDVGIVDAAETHVDRGVRSHRRAEKVLHASDYSALPEQHQRRFSLLTLRAAVVRQFASRRVLNRVSNSPELDDPNAMKRLLNGVLSQFSQQ